MNLFRNQLRSLGKTCQEAWQTLAPVCNFRGCAQTTGAWRRLRNRPRGVRLHGDRCCQPECLEGALIDLLRRVRSTLPPAASAHRVPLGLLLLSRQQLTAVQLLTALDAQRSAGRGRIGEWLQELGFVSEQQVTAALARQFSCPVLRTTAIASSAPRVPVLPFLLLESFRMIPVDFVEAKATLYVAFSERIDHTVLYAIEQMLRCRTEPCMIYPDLLRRALLAHAHLRPAVEIVFDRVADTLEFARIVGNYAAEIHAVEIRLAFCGAYIWARLERRSGPALDLVLRTPADALSTSFHNGEAPGIAESPERTCR